ncbi:hypothetical protein RJ639_042027 [Escallonia herrerae]|uniref:G-box binding protein multifunctional mosaic region domain-containing protein n=1 Tax=Escallonia herrerae TaxID=1293975 RepID=A0AA88WEJ8_9ASTE|nr:hypothetical protein RJ639_042027 [Escallonia herrerae]
MATVIRHGEGTMSTVCTLRAGDWKCYMKQQSGVYSDKLDAALDLNESKHGVKIEWSDCCTVGLLVQFMPTYATPPHPHVAVYPHGGIYAHPSTPPTARMHNMPLRILRY